MTDEERKSLGIETLPGDMAEAIYLAETSDLVRKALGDHVFEKLIANKKIDLKNYRAQITSYELEQYLPVL